MFACFAFANAQAYTLSTGAVVDKANLPAPRQSGNGAAAEKWCAEDYTDVGNGMVRKFGEPGEVQYRPFWIHSGVGAYVRCVSK